MKKHLEIVCMALAISGIGLNLRAEDATSGIMKDDFMKKVAKEKEKQAREDANRAIRQEKIIEVNSVNFLKFNKKIGEIFIPNSEVADIEMLNDKSLYLSGLKPGTTSLVIHDREGKVLVDYEIKVTYPLNEIRRAISKVAPNVNIELVSVDDTIILKGRVPSPEIAADIQDIVGRFMASSGGDSSSSGGSDKIINRLTIETATQVMLKVKVAEVTRTVSRSLGVNWRAMSSAKGINDGLIGMVSSNGTAPFPEYMADLPAAQEALYEEGAALTAAAGSGGRWFVSAGVNNLAALVDALASESFGCVLAEPTLIALSGQSATFKSGGQQGYVVKQANSDSNTTEFKDWGTSIEFTPVVLSEDRINIKIKAEVSTIDFANGATDGTPSVLSKNVETVVELGSGQSLALAGLIQTDKSKTMNKNPLLSRIPVLGSLFAYDSSSLNEREIIVIVTPVIVKPSSKPLSTPMDNMPKLLAPVDALLMRQFTDVKGTLKNTGFILK